MQQFLLEFERYCEKPDVASGKARSYAKAVQCLCNYLDITVINDQAIEHIRSIENAINDRNSEIYKELLDFLEKRRQRSYLENGFIRAALKPLYSFINTTEAGRAENVKQIGSFDSWEIVDEKTAIKHCDKSFFDHRGTGVPKAIIWFFGAEEMAPGETKIISIVFDGKSYQGRVANDSTNYRRVRIFWSSELADLFCKYNVPDAIATFRKTEDDTYEVSMSQINTKQQNGWLLVWNPKNWRWTELTEACKLTQSGGVYKTTWSCVSSGVKVGDLVFIITLGTSKNGIVAVGRAASEQYEYEHWDTNKRAEGKTNKGIDIELEYIIDPTIEDPLFQTFLKGKYPEQHWSPQGSGISIKTQYIEELYHDWIEHISKLEGGEVEMTIKEKVAAIKAYIAARGFDYEGDLIENFYLSLKSKPFVILAGTSGTGKTKLVEYFAEAIGAKMQLVPVRPDWSDSSDLFGHKDLSGNFHPGAIIDFIKSATDSPSVPHFLCLDEMNLARVEYYMSDMLSIIETRRFNDQHKVVTKPLIAKDYCICANGRNDYGELGIPDNLYIIGTVNMDETTFPFSKKVLDRANTIEFSFVDLTRKALPIVQYEAQELDNSFLKAEYLHLIDCGDDQLIDDICFELNVWNQILVKANLHVGYRVRDEICFYMMNNKKSELLDFETAFDHEIMQKILPRVQGSSSAIKDVLSELFVKCAGDYAGFDGTAAYEKMQSYLDAKPCKYPNSAKKIAFMMRRYEEDGFTSYWL